MVGGKDILLSQSASSVTTVHFFRKYKENIATWKKVDNFQEKLEFSKSLQKFIYYSKLNTKEVTRIFSSFVVFGFVSLSIKGFLLKLLDRNSDKGCNKVFVYQNKNLIEDYDVSIHIKSL